MGINVAIAMMDASDGSWFEHDVAERLRYRDWAARVCGGIGDQGADIIAEKRGLLVVFQCKHYSGRVGNKAVQEAYAARTFTGGHTAAVVTAIGYTRSARELARALLVHLLLLRDLDSAYL